MRISAYIPAYNGEKYIEEQLESIRAQTRRVDEVFVRDDGSSDATRALVAAFIAKHGLKDWHLLEDHAHLGLDGGHRALWERVNGDLVFVVDHDDIWMPDKVEVMAALMKQRPELSLLIGGYGYCDAHSEPFWREKWDREDNTLHPIPLTDFLPHSVHPGCAFCVRGDVIRTARELGSPDCWQSIGQDWFLAVMSCAMGGVEKLRRVTFLHRIHGQNSSRERVRSSTVQGTTPTLRLSRWKQAAAAHRWFLETPTIAALLTAKQAKQIEQAAAYIEKRIRLQETRNPFLAISLLFDRRAFLHTPRSLKRRLRDYAADISYTYGINPKKRVCK
ncbi:MAG: glycosyltransferase [Clostridiales bacterium]|nr:glycosyltransferase [Clostridiales bacterium]